MTYTINDLDILKDKKYPIQTKQKRGKSEKRVYYNVPCAFDIETSSWYEGEEKRACMYIWQFGIDGVCFTGRTWKEFKVLYDYLIKNFTEASFVCYVHNLSFEYQWIKYWFHWSKVFEVEDRKPVQCITKEGFEFRCSYMLSGKSLENTAKELLKYKVDKLHTLDYKLLRTSDSVLTDEEIEYCINDIKVVMNYIKEKIEQDGGIINIPLTRTGYVRKRCKDACFGKGKDRTQYQKFMRNLQLTSDVYEMCKRAFQGGYVHCNPAHSNEIRKNVASFDLTSSYPTSMIAYNLYPMSSPIQVKINNKEEFEHYIKYYACIFDITYYDIKLKKDKFMAAISESKCWGEINKPVVDNGRVISAKMLSTTITEQDYELYNEIYQYKEMSIGTMYIFERGYLPKQLVDTILKLYEDKTQLKGVKGRELDYMLSKGDLNCIFGMVCTLIEKQQGTVEEYNKSFNRFLYYPWALYITALSRRAVFSGINACGYDLIYTDTDSLKVLNYKQHLDYIEKYNTFIVDKLKVAMKYYGFDINRVVPKNIKGEECPLGIWTFEGVYSEFKAIRSKAYVGKMNGEYELTLSGVNKKAGIEYLISQGNPMELLKDGFIFPAGKSGKLTHTYIDTPMKGTVIDYQGHKSKYNEKSGVHLEETSYVMDAESEFVAFYKYMTTGLYMAQ